MFEASAFERARKSALDERWRRPEPILRDGGAAHPAFGQPAHAFAEPLAAGAPPAYVLKFLRRGETLFKQGDHKKYLYRVESGRLSLLLESAKAPATRIEDLSPGVVFDLGYRERHIYSAIALADSTVSCWPKNALAYLTQSTPSLAQKAEASIEREIAHVRAVVRGAAAAKPLARLALFLSVLSRQNAREGKNPQVIDETMRCGTVADYLKMDVETLGRALIALERRKIIASLPPNKLFIRDPALLERLTEAV